MIIYDRHVISGSRSRVERESGPVDRSDDGGPAPGIIRSDVPDNIWPVTARLFGQYPFFYYTIFTKKLRVQIT